MNIEFGFTDEATNTRFAPVAALSAYYQTYQVLKPLESVNIAMKTLDFTPTEKLIQVLLSILTGCEYLSVVNTRLRPERKLAQVWRTASFAHQSTLSDTLDALTQMNLEQLALSIGQISRSCSRTRRHDWRGFLFLDFDLSGLPCGKTAQGSQKGYFSGKKTSLDANWHGSAPFLTWKRYGQTCFRETKPRLRACARRCRPSKLRLSSHQPSASAPFGGLTAVLGVMTTCAGCWRVITKYSLKATPVVVPRLWHGKSAAGTSTATMPGSGASPRRSTLVAQCRSSSKSGVIKQLGNTVIMSPQCDSHRKSPYLTPTICAAAQKSSNFVKIRAACTSQHDANGTSQPRNHLSCLPTWLTTCWPIFALVGWRTPALPRGG